MLRGRKQQNPHRADDKALVRQPADDTVMLQKYPVMLRAVAASSHALTSNKNLALLWTTIKRRISL